MKSGVNISTQTRNLFPDTKLKIGNFSQSNFSNPTFSNRFRLLWPKILAFNCIKRFFDSKLNMLILPTIFFPNFFSKYCGKPRNFSQISQFEQTIPRINSGPQCPELELNKSFESPRRDYCREVRQVSEIPKTNSRTLCVIGTPMLILKKQKK